MGAWGYNFFENDHDLDVVLGLDQAAGLSALESKAKERAKHKQAQSKDANATKPNDPTNTDEEDDYLLISMYAGHCADIELVREHLDGGVLRKLIDEKKATMGNNDRAVYEFVILGACAMSLGCEIPDDFKQLLIEKYRSTELPPMSLHAMQLALGDGPHRYRNAPYDFGEKGLDETVEERMAEEEGKGSNGQIVGMNVPAPFGLFGSFKGGPVNEYPAGVCGGCGAKDRLDGEPLLSCGKCKVKKYCGTVCQRAHFKQHKRVCKAK
jgi:hypothetical protein